MPLTNTDSSWIKFGPLLAWTVVLIILSFENPLYQFLLLDIATAYLVLGMMNYIKIFLKGQSINKLFFKNRLSFNLFFTITTLVCIYYVATLHIAAVAWTFTHSYASILIGIMTWLAIQKKEVNH